MDRNKQDTEEALATLVTALKEGLDLLPIERMDSIAKYAVTGPTTLRVSMANKREVVVTVRGL